MGQDADGEEVEVGEGGRRLIGCRTARRHRDGPRSISARFTLVFDHTTEALMSESAATTTGAVEPQRTAT
ncbi:MAG: hypothetical protein J2P53_18505, partial [Bradyrhizobiaceae bacterium]|nr:hypothetical protein [Bradyrhizobiaceae bacterium]